MEIRYEKFGFYTVDLEYLRYLNAVDDEVRFSEERHYETKPFLGILIMVGNYPYFVPLSSRKPRHARMDNVGRDYYLIYERIPQSARHAQDIVKLISNSECLRILALLDIRKMIPVPDGVYHPIIFDDVSDARYRSLLAKEFSFCRSIKEGLLEKVAAVYRNQKSSGRVYFGYCNFSALEAACDQYPKRQTGSTD